MPAFSWAVSPIPGSARRSSAASRDACRGQARSRCSLPISSSTQEVDAFWSRPATEMLSALGSSRDGLSNQASAQRLRALGPNRVADEAETSALRLFLKQFESPLAL